MRTLVSTEIRAISGGKGLIKAVVGLAVGKKLIAEIKKNLKPHPTAPKPVKKA